MAKTLTFQYDGREYTLEFTRRTVREMENRGFTPSMITDKPMTTLPDLFAGAFLAHHRGTKREVIDEIFDRMTGKSELVSKLAEMYNEPILTLIEDPEEDAAGNVLWTASF